MSYDPHVSKKDTGTYWADHDDEELNASTRVARHQMSVMKQQDVEAAELLRSVERMREIGTAIGTETDISSKQLDDLHDETEATNSKVGKVMKAMGSLGADESNYQTYCCILVLVVVLILVIVAATGGDGGGLMSGGGGSATAAAPGAPKSPVSPGGGGGQE